MSQPRPFKLYHFLPIINWWHSPFKNMFPSKSVLSIISSELVLTRFRLLVRVNSTINLCEFLMWSCLDRLLACSTAKYSLFYGDLALKYIEEHVGQEVSGWNIVTAVWSITLHYVSIVYTDGCYARDVNIFTLKEIVQFVKPSNESQIVLKTVFIVVIKINYIMNLSELGLLKT